MSVEKPLICNLFYVEMSVGKKNPIVLQTGNTHQKNNYPLEYTNEIILSVIGSGIWSTFIPTL